MEWIKNLKIADKLTAFLAIALSFVVLMGVIGFVFTSKANKGIDQLYESNLKTISELGTIRGNYEQGVADVLYMYDDISAAQKKHWLEDLKGLRAENGELLKAYRESELSDYEKERIDKIMEISKTFWANMYTSIDYANAGNVGAASRIFNNNLHYIIETRGLIGDLIKYNEDEAKNVDAQNANDSTTANAVLIIVMLTSFGLLTALGLMITHMITDPIKHAVGELTTGSSEVAAAASQVENASQSLAEGTTEQAASIQETSSTLEETSSMVQQNNENTKQAAIMAKNAKDFAQKSNQEMHTMMTSMDDLKQSSNEIAKIIKVIDEIAFQTNILSLNAAVEAARAGDAGKGFAVVAEEVRNLAQRSAQAAKDTASIIENNIALSEQSVVIAKNVNGSLTQIDEESRKVSQLLEEISTATEEQSRGITEISKAIQQMEQVMQSNSSSADESASASRELASQAANVNEIVRSLIRLVEGANAVNTSNQYLIEKAKRNQPIRPTFQKPTGTKVVAKAPTTKTTPAATPKPKSPEDIIPLDDF